MGLKFLNKNFIISFFILSCLYWVIYYFNFNGKLFAGIITFIAILLAFSIRKNKNRNVRDIGSLNIDKNSKINVWKDSINYRYKKTAIRFLSLSKIYGIKIWENSFNSINYFSNKDLQKVLKPKVYPKNYKINIWDNVFNKK